MLERELEWHATVDVLTGIANRRAILDQLNHAHQHYLRHQQSLTVCILDLDYFKRINDQHGHLAGDQLLEQLVTVVRTELRSIDLFGRLGGEEFLLILDNTPPDKANELAERILQTLRQSDFDIGVDEPVRMTASIGATCVSPADQTLTTVLKRADKALYQAKESGRDRICWQRSTSASKEPDRDLPDKM